jgi:DNA gyrase/topoisomerase IV subunit B
MQNNNSKKQKYVKKDPISHIIDRPDMYVGSTRSRKTEEYVVVDDQFHIEKRTIDVSPAILRIFIEPLSNIVDNVARSSKNKNKVSKICINIDETTGETTFWNDGDVIPVELHPEEKCYNHSMIFGQLLTSSNYDDEEDRENISGRNGLGIKVANVFSKKFYVEGADPEHKKLLKQTWENNMRKVSEPTITTLKTKKGYTKIVFTPDFSQFGLTGYTTDILSLYKRFIVDTAMLTKVPTFYNDIEIPVKNLIDYSKLYTTKEVESLYIKCAESEAVIMLDENNGNISFANGIYTPLGGTHVDAWNEAIFRPLLDKINKPKKPQLNISDIKKFFKLFIVATVKKPEFDSQSKTKLEAPQINVEVKKTHITTICSWSIMERLEDMIRAKEMVVLKKSERKKRGHEKIEGLDPANNEGGSKGKECTLILVEGLSAKTYAVWGIQKGAYGKSGRDWYGIYALRGKVLNTRNATPTSVSKNNVVTDIIKALGLRYDDDYTKDENFEKLRYGKLMVITDADSVVGDTPIILKNSKGFIEIKTIDTICDNWNVLDTGKEYSSTDFQVWTEKGWSRIKSVMRHRVNKDIYRVATNSGVVDVTEDHSLIDNKGEKISPKDLHVGCELLHHFVDRIEHTEHNSETMFYVGRFWYTMTYQAISILLQNKNNEEITKFKNTFFDSNNRKIIPVEILNCRKETQHQFILGVLSGAMKLVGNDYKLTFKDKITAQCVYFLSRYLGYDTFFETDKDGNICLYVFENRYTNEQDKNRVKEIINFGSSEQYVYDLETDNHHFQAGLGDMIVHNTDGLHISGLIQNLFHSLFPTLLKREEPFLVGMQTPIVRVYLGKSDKLFYDEREYKKYVLMNSDKKINKKYYKGLGASNEQDVKETFGQKMIEFYEDEKTFETMNKAFHNKHSDQRKDWLEKYDSNNVVLKWKENLSEKIRISYSDYINTELIKFSLDDCKRSIPNLIDGMKESHRKVLFVCFKRNLKYSGKTLKVAQLAGSVAEKSGYHHGEQNLYNTITGMANEFVGSNNIPLLYRDGQFGSRIVGGDDAANARYIYTKLDYLTRMIYKEEDDVLLEYLEDDGESVEPKFYVPIIPMVLVNGCSCGIGTGWSSYIPCYNPLDLVESIKTWLEYDGNVVKNEEELTISLLPEIKPWYRGYTGQIEKVDETKYISWGKVEKDTKNKYIVNELPVGMWTDDFKDKLEDMKVEKQINNYKNYSTPKIVNFSICENEDGIKCDLNGLKLFKFIRTTNMVLFTDSSKLRKFNSTDEIIDEFCKIRYGFYTKRKNYILNKLEYNIKFLGNKKRFLQEVRDGEIKLFEVKNGKRESRTSKDIVKDLESRGYDKNREDTIEDDNNNEKDIYGYEYLLRLQIGSITAEKINKLQNDIDSNIKERDKLSSKTEKDLWLEDLDNFSVEYKKWLTIMEKDNNGRKK